VRRALAALLLALAIPAARAAPVAAPAAARSWRAEFDAVCAKTQDAMALPDAELRDLVARCDALLPELAKLGESERKVFTRRLQACRNLYQFVLDSREKR
jgi:hypothetical protein